VQEIKDNIIFHLYYTSIIVSQKLWFIKKKTKDPHELKMKARNYWSSSNKR